MGALSWPSPSRHHPPAAATPPRALLAVWGPKGAPGRTTVAVNLAFEAAPLVGEVLLVDADTYGGAVAHANIQEHHRNYLGMTRGHGRHLACPTSQPVAPPAARPTLVQPTLALMGESIPLR